MIDFTAGVAPAALGCCVVPAGIHELGQEMH